MFATENTLNARMLSMENFGSWLLAELEKRDWSQSDLVKTAGISRGTLSNIISGTRGVGNESMIAIAHALKMSPVTIFRKAGLLPEGGDDTNFEDWQYLINKLPTEEQEEVRKIIEMKIERRQKEDRSARASSFTTGKVKK